MKLSVSLPDDDVAFLDQRAAGNRGSRSAALHEAVALLRRAELEQDYADAFAEWSGSEDALLWDRAAADGLTG